MVQLVTGVWTVPPNLIGKEILQTIYWPYFVYDSKTVLLHVVILHSDGFSICSQQESPNGAETSVKTEEKVEKAAAERLGALNFATGLLNLQMSSHLHAFFDTCSLCTLNDDRRLEKTAVKQLQSTDFGFFLLYASLPHEVVEALYVEGSAVKSPRMIELHYEGTDIFPPATTAKLRLS